MALVENIDGNKYYTKIEELTTEDVVIEKPKEETKQIIINQVQVKRSPASKPAPPNQQSLF